MDQARKALDELRGALQAQDRTLAAVRRAVEGVRSPAPLPVAFGDLEDLRETCGVRASPPSRLGRCGGVRC